MANLALSMMEFRDAYIRWVGEVNMLHLKVQTAHSNAQGAVRVRDRVCKLTQLVNKFWEAAVKADRHASRQSRNVSSCLRCCATACTAALCC